jgi:hypothetical protein
MYYTSQNNNQENYAINVDDVRFLTYIRVNIRVKIVMKLGRN